MLSVAYLAAFLGFATASIYPLRRDGSAALQRRQKGPNYTPHNFTQVIDHYPKNPRYAPHTNATFQQRYLYDDTYYKPGGPVFLYIGGETTAESRQHFLSDGIIALLAQQFNGLGIVLENRYYGHSYPFNTTTTDQLAYHTTEQTIADNAYFAQNVKIPGMNSSINAPNTPWILYGGSLAGAQTAFSMVAHGDVLYGGIAASGTIEPVVAYPTWYRPIQLYAPQDCVASINNIVDKFDAIRTANLTSAVKKFKDLFGLGKLKDDRDFAQVIAWPIGGPFNYLANTWQELNWDDTYGSQDFWDFCRNVTDINAPANNTAADKLLANYTNGEPWTNLGNYAAYIKRVINPECPSGDYANTACFGTQNQSYFADVTNSEGRSYLYTSCVEQGAFQVAPSSGPSLISRVLQTDYMQQWCNWAFPKGKYNSIPPQPDLSYYKKYGGFHMKADRLAFIDGSSDVWRDLCWHSYFAPSPRGYSDLQPQYLIEGAGHHWDSYSYGVGKIATEPQYIRESHYWEIRVVSRWLSGFEDWRKSKHG